MSNNLMFWFRGIMDTTDLSVQSDSSESHDMVS